MTIPRSDPPDSTPSVALLTPRNWRLETLLRLFVILFLGFATGGVVVSSLAAMARHGGWKIPAGVNLVIGTLAFLGMIACIVRHWFILPAWWAAKRNVRPPAENWRIATGPNSVGLSMKYCRFGAVNTSGSFGGKTPGATGTSN